MIAYTGCAKANGDVQVTRTSYRLGGATGERTHGTNPHRLAYNAAITCISALRASSEVAS